MSSGFESSSLVGSAPGSESPAPERHVLRDILDSFERDLIVTVLIAAGGNQKRAARALGVLPTTFQEKLKRFGLLNHRPGNRVRRGERERGSIEPGPSSPDDPISKEEDQA